MEVYSIGFTQNTAAQFFGKLNDTGIGLLIDVRLNNTSQLAGFAKRDDLEYFLHELVGAAYHHEPLLAPDAELLKAYRSKEIDWSDYAEKFIELMRARAIESALDWDSLLEGPAVLLCSESSAEFCHRRLVIEYLVDQGFGLVATHL
jgi:uncharacterized protein (DUF488 family)